MKNKEKLIPIMVFILTFTVFISVFLIINNSNKEVYSCYDSENDKTYTFNTEEEMHKVCDSLNGTDDDAIMDNYAIYDDLINANDPSYAFYPYINSDKTLSIIIAIVDCNNQALAKDKAEKWFSDHSYNMGDYTIEYEYPCNTN